MLRGGDTEFRRRRILERSSLKHSLATDRVSMKHMRRESILELDMGGTSARLWEVGRSSLRASILSGDILTGSLGANVDEGGALTLCPLFNASKYLPISDIPLAISPFVRGFQHRPLFLYPSGIGKTVGSILHNTKSAYNRMKPMDNKAPTALAFLSQFLRRSCFVLTTGTETSTGS